MKPRFAPLARLGFRHLLPPLAVAFALGAGCSPDAPLDDDGSGNGASSGVGGAMGGTGGGTAGGGVGGGLAGASPVTGGTGGTGGVSAGAGGASGGAVAAGGVGGAQGGSGGVPLGGAAGVAGQVGGAGSAGSPAAGGDAGSVATGGMAGAAGDLGGAGAGAAGAGGTAPTGFLVEDFDGVTAGQVPAGWDTFIAWNKNGQNPSGGAEALVSSTRARSGTNSMHFVGGSNPAQITRPLPSGTNKLYVRAWFYMTRQLGMNPGANHETLIGIRQETGGANNEVRFGEIKGVIGTNEVPTDNIAPKMDQWGLGPAISANAWHCYEVAFLADQAQHTLHAWIDGALVHEITAGDQWQNGAMPATWLNGKFVEVVLGWHSFSSASNELWMDDLVLSTSPIGCG